MSKKILKTQLTTGKQRVLLIALGISLAAVSLLVLELLLFLLGKGEIPSHDPFFDFQASTPLFEANQASDGTTIYQTRVSKLKFFNMQQFPAQKDANTFRVFALGGSTTFGRPYDWQVSFPNWMLLLLEASGTGKNIEVINAGGVSYASYRVKSVMQEVLNYQPDLLVVYSGHNEFLEERVYGDRLKQNALLKSTLTHLSGLRSVRLIKHLFSSKPSHHLDAEVKAKLDVWEGLASFSRNEPLKQSILQHFEVNIAQMIALARRQQVPILFVSPAANLCDFSPFKSQHRAGMSRQELERFNEAFRTGQRLAEQAAHQQALVHLLRAESLDGDYAALHFAIAKSLLASGDFDKAELHFLRARQLDICPLRSLSEINMLLARSCQREGVPLIELPAILAERGKSVNGHGILGNSFFLDHVHPTMEVHQLLAETLVATLFEAGWLSPNKVLDQPSKQLLYAELVQSLDPSYYALRDLNLAKVLGWAGKYEEATQALLRSEHILLGNVDMHYNLGVLYEKQDKFNLALVQYQKAVAGEPDFFEAHFNAGKVLSKLGRHAEAAQFFDRATHIRPESAEALFNLASAYFNSSSLDQAAQSLSALETTGQTFPGEQRLRGRLLMSQGQLTGAVMALRADVAANPERAQSYYYLGLAQARAGSLLKARLSFSRVIELEPSFVEGYRNLGLIDESLGQDSVAVAFYQKAIELAPSDALLHFELGLLHHKKSRLAEAITAYERATQLDDSHVKAHNNLGVVWGELKRYDKAIEAFEKTVNLNPNAVDAHYNLAQLRWVGGDTRQAAAHLKKAIALGQQPSKQILDALRDFL